MSISVRNHEGYMDLTARHALTSIRREEKHREQYRKLIFVGAAITVGGFIGGLVGNTNGFFSVLSNERFDKMLGAYEAERGRTERAYWELPK